MLRVGVIGPESTGKSTLCRQLSEQYGYLWIKEYAREYVEALDRPYTRADLDAIAGHLIEQISTRYNEPVVLFDTELIIMKVWYEHKYGSTPDAVLRALRDYPMDMYLILTPDICAEPDPVRENLDKREYFLNWYIEEVKLTHRPYVLVSGQGSARTLAAAQAIESFRHNCANRPAGDSRQNK